jgi:AraC-like DNA-binding protein
VEYFELPPPVWLRHVVRCFWYLQGSGRADDVQTVVPDGRTEIVLHLGEPFSLLGDDGVPRLQARVLAAGQLLGPIRLAPSRSADVVGIRFRTDAGRAALGAGLTDLTGQVVPLAELHPRLEARLLDAVHGRAPAEQVAALSPILAALPAGQPVPLVRLAVAALEGPSGPAGRIRQLARSLHTTPRTLERRIRDATGLSPRGVASVARFRRAFRRLDQAPVGTWSRVALESGYYDQSHMIREFRRFAGTAPSQFFQRDPELARSLSRGE